MAFCDQCGQSLKDGSKFCHHCGARHVSPADEPGVTETQIPDLRRFTPTGLPPVPAPPNAQEQQPAPQAAIRPAHVENGALASNIDQPSHETPRLLQPDVHQEHQPPNQPATKNRSVHSRACIVGASILAICVAAAVIFTFLLQNKGKAIPKSIKDFANGAATSVKKGSSEPYAFGTQTAYEGNWDGDRVTFEVDNSTGEVRGLFRYGQKGSDVKIADDEAEKTATNFARQHYADFDKLRLKKVRDDLIDHGQETNKFYSFGWQRYDTVANVALPNSVEVRVNAQTGKVDSYASFRTNVTISTKPRISKDEAGKVAVSATIEDVPGARIVGEPVCGVTTLPVGEPNGKQALLWEVSLEVSPDKKANIPGAVVYVNAESGKVEKVDPFL